MLPESGDEPGGCCMGPRRCARITVNALQRNGSASALGTPGSAILTSAKLLVIEGTATFDMWHLLSAATYFPNEPGKHFPDLIRYSHHNG